MSKLTAWLEGGMRHVVPMGWKCSRDPLHVGPCAAYPRWWNLSRFARQVRRGGR